MRAVLCTSVLVALLAPASAAQCKLQTLHHPAWIASMLSDVAVSNGTVLAGVGTDVLYGSNEGSASFFELTEDGGYEIQTIAPPDVSRADRFGEEVELDGRYALIGNASDFHFHPGIVYAYERKASGWTLIDELTAADGAVGDLFGSSFDLDGERAVIGASKLGGGVVYVYELVQGVWTEVAELAPSSPEPYASFGFGVALSGDRIVAASAWESVGAVHVFELDAGVWNETARLEEPAPSDFSFGARLALDGDTLVVGSSSYEHDGYYGAAFVYDFANGMWGAPQRLTSTVNSVSANFGRAVDVLGDCIAIGSPADSNWQGGASSVELFRRTPSGWETEGPIQEPGPPGVLLGESQIGDAVALSPGGLAYLATAPWNLSTPPEQVRVLTTEGDVQLVAGPTAASGASAQQALRISACPELAGTIYAIVGSLSGPGPGVEIEPGVELPLVIDAYTFLTLTQSSATLDGGIGFLDAEGEANASFQLPPSLGASLVGSSVWHTAVLLDDELDPIATSGTVELELVP